MLEILVVVASVAGLFSLARGNRSHQTSQVNASLLGMLTDRRGEDLPCPWCYAPTDETDTRCRGCGRKFG